MISSKKLDYQSFFNTYSSQLTKRSLSSNQSWGKDLLATISIPSLLSKPKNSNEETKENDENSANITPVKDKNDKKPLKRKLAGKKKKEDVEEDPNSLQFPSGNIKKTRKKKNEVENENPILEETELDAKPAPKRGRKKVQNSQAAQTKRKRLTDEEEIEVISKPTKKLKTTKSKKEELIVEVEPEIETKESVVDIVDPNTTNINAELTYVETVPKDQYEKARQKFEVLKGKYDSLRLLKGDWTRLLEEEKSKRSEMEEEMQKYKSMVEDLKENNSQIDQEKQDLISTCNELKKTNSKLSSQLEKFKKSNKEKSEKMDTDTQELQETIIELKTEIEELKEENKKRIDSLQKENKSLSGLVSTLEKKLTNEKTQRSTEKADLTERISQLLDNNEEETQLKKMNSELLEKLEKLKKDVKCKENDIISKENELKTIEKGLQTAEKENKKLTQNIENLEKLTSDLKQEKEKDVSILKSQLEVESNKWVKEKSVLEESIEGLKTKMEKKSIQSKISELLRDSFHPNIQILPNSTYDVLILKVISCHHPSVSVSLELSRLGDGMIHSRPLKVKNISIENTSDFVRNEIFITESSLPLYMAKVLVDVTHVSELTVNK